MLILLHKASRIRILQRSQIAFALKPQLYCFLTVAKSYRVQEVHERGQYHQLDIRKKDNRFIVILTLNEQLLQELAGGGNDQTVHTDGAI